MSEFGTNYGYHPAIKEVIKRQNELFQGKIFQELQKPSISEISEGIQIILYSQSKVLKLEVRFYERDGVMSGYVNKTLLENPGGDTQLVFKAAHELGQKIADVSGLPIYYNFNPMHPTMQVWAQEKGKEIFNWENKADLDSEDGTGVYQTVYHPKE